MSLAPSGILTVTGTLTPNQAREIEAAWRHRYAGCGGRPLVLEDGVRFLPTQPAGLIKCAYCGHYGALGSCESCGAPNAPTSEPVTPHVTGRYRPDFPPNQRVVMPGFWSLCLWFGHRLQWQSQSRTYAQEVCVRCGHTGATQRRPAPPPAPPVRLNCNEGVKQ